MSSSETKLDYLIKLKNQLITFLDELIETFPKEPDFVIFRIFVKDQIPTEMIMDYIVENLCPLKDLVKSRNESFFLDRNVLFEKLSQDHESKINHFKRIWQSGTLDKNDKEVLWKWFETFIFIGNKYIQMKN